MELNNGSNFDHQRSTEVRQRLENFLRESVKVRKRNNFSFDRFNNRTHYDLYRAK